MANGPRIELLDTQDESLEVALKGYKMEKSITCFPTFSVTSSNQEMLVHLQSCHHHIMQIASSHFNCEATEAGWESAQMHKCAIQDLDFKSYFVSNAYGIMKCDGNVKYWSRWCWKCFFWAPPHLSTQCFRCRDISVHTLTIPPHPHPSHLLTPSAPQRKLDKVNVWRHNKETNVHA